MAQLTHEGQIFAPGSQKRIALLRHSAVAAALLDGPSVMSVTVVVAEILFERFTDVGFREQLVPIMVGVEHVSATLLLIPVNGAMVSEELPFWPAMIVKELGVGVIEKSGWFTVMNGLVVNALA
jgi:hypothetical protein